MKHALLWITLIAAAVFAGCSNVKYVQARSDCDRNLMFVIPWDTCGEKGEHLPQQKMVGDSSAIKTGSVAIVDEEPSGAVDEGESSAVDEGDSPISVNDGEL